MKALVLLVVVSGLFACGDNTVATSDGGPAVETAALTGDVHQFLSDSTGPYQPLHYVSCNGHGATFNDPQRMITDRQLASGFWNTWEGPAGCCIGQSVACQGDQLITGFFNDAKSTVTAPFASLVDNGAYGATIGNAAQNTCRTQWESNVLNRGNVTVVQTRDLAHWIGRTDFRDSGGCNHVIVARYTQIN